MKKNYDLTIIGGGTAGCACAYIAAKLGLSVLLVEKKSYLGGSMTSSLVIPAMKTSENAINNDFYNEFYNKLHKLGGAITYCDNNKGWFNPELSKIVLDSMLKSQHVDVCFETNVQKIEKNLSSYTVTLYDDNIIESQKTLLVHTETKYLVDASGDAKISELLNYEFLENKNSQPMNLRFVMSGINSKIFSEWILDYDNNRDVTTACCIDGKYYFSTAYTWDDNVKWALKPLFEDAIKNNILTKEDANYFQVFSIAGTPDSVAFNCPRLINNKLSRSEAYILGRESILRISQFCKKYFPGFENAYISSIADSLGVRVSNRVKGKYVYTKEDLICGKKFENPVLISSYPIDIHSDKQDKSVLQKVMQEYQLPLESLIVDDNFFVVGRCISADYEAQAALRIIPSCFSMGEGLAKHLANIIKC